MNYKKVTISSGILIIICFACYELMNSRNFQLFGRIYSMNKVNEKVAALTFDDGPLPVYTDKILTILSKENVKGTFYLTGNEIKSDRNDALKIVLAGHEIGNHSYSHKRMIFRSWNFIKTEIEATDSLIKSIGYNKITTFRPPYCKKLFLLPLYMAMNNRITITCNIEPDSDSALSSNSLKMVDYVSEHIQPGSIILFHVMNKSRSESLNAVEPVIRSLKSKGYSFVTVSRLMEYKSY